MKDGQRPVDRLDLVFRPRGRGVDERRAIVFDRYAVTVDELDPCIFRLLVLNGIVLLPEEPVGAGTTGENVGVIASE